MFVREKRIGAYSYLYLVETVRENGKTKQRIVRNLGRKEMVEARGDLDRLARSAARLSRRSMILSLIEGGGVPDVRCRRIGAPLLFERLWRDSGCRAMVEELLAGRRFCGRARRIPDRAAPPHGVGLGSRLRVLAQRLPHRRHG
jgi:hypothetical protein